MVYQSIYLITKLRKQYICVCVSVCVFCSYENSGSNRSSVRNGRVVVYL